jgi:hypothetical protein
VFEDFHLIIIEILDIGMTIVCDENGKFEIQHWPPLPIDDSVAILQILNVRIVVFVMGCLVLL